MLDEIIEMFCLKKRLGEDVSKRGWIPVVLEEEQE